MKVFAWVDQLPGMGIVKPLVDVWAANWAKWGFEPITLTWSDAGDTRELHRLMAERPTSNSAVYELGCWARWQAFHERMLPFGDEPALMTDLDCIPAGHLPIGPSLIKESLQQWNSRFKTPVQFFERYVGCAMVGASGAGRRQLVDWVREWKRGPDSYGHGQCSDMVAFKDVTLGRHHEWCAFPLCCSFGDDDCRSYPIWHFSAAALAKLGFPHGMGDKARFMKQRVR